MNAHEPAPRHEAPAPKSTPQTRAMAEAARPGVTVRVAVLNDRQDEEEKEAGYGHGV
jgi:hypothetical protein